MYLPLYLLWTVKSEKSFQGLCNASEKCKSTATSCDWVNWVLLHQSCDLWAIIIHVKSTTNNDGNQQKAKNPIFSINVSIPQTAFLVISSSVWKSFMQSAWRTQSDFFLVVNSKIIISISPSLVSWKCTMLKNAVWVSSLLGFETEATSVKEHSHCTKIPERAFLNFSLASSISFSWAAFSLISRRMWLLEDWIME